MELNCRYEKLVFISTDKTHYNKGINIKLERVKFVAGVVNVQNNFYVEPSIQNAMKTLTKKYFYLKNKSTRLSVSGLLLRNIK